MSDIERCNIAIIGAGPSGLGTGETAGSEGFSATLVEAEQHYGGQARDSSLVENVPGIVAITGEALAANMQAQNKGFGVSFRGGTRVVSIRPEGKDGLVVLDYNQDEIVRADTVVLSTGVEYRRHQAEGLEGLLGQGIVYGPPNQKERFNNQNIFIGGGGNSAGQLARHLAENCEGCTVNLLIRGEEIRKGMSEYLASRIEQTPGITVHTKTKLERVEGTNHLEKVFLDVNGTKIEMDADEMFLMIGADPRTRWLGSLVERSQHGFIRTGRALSDEARERFLAECGEQPQDFETATPGIFAVGDVRDGSIKRIATSSAEGVGVITQIRAHLQTQGRDHRG